MAPVDERTFSAPHASADVRALVAASAGAALAATYVLAVHTRAGQVLDTRAMRVAARDLADATWTSALLAAVSPMSVLLAVASLALLLWAGRGTAAALTATATATGTILAAVALKVTLVRPFLIDDAVNSFPSGHVAAISGLAAGATIAVQPALRPLVALVGLIGVSLTGLATLALQWHRPSDVLGSTLLAVTVAAVADLVVAPASRMSRTAGVTRP